MNLKAKFMNLFRENVNISKKISVGLLSLMIILSSLTPVVNANDLPSTGVSKASQVRERGGLAPVDIKKWVGDKVDWKDGVKAKDSVSEENKAKINELLKEARFEEMSARNTNEASRKKGKTDKDSREEEGFKGNIKVRFKDDSTITVENQTLYVSDFITSSTNENAPTDAIEAEFKLGEGVKVDNTDGTIIYGNKDNPVSYQKYKVKPNTNLKTYKNQSLNETYYNLINSKVKATDKNTEPVWNGENGLVTENFTITESNKVFIATATKTFKVTVQANGGTGDDIVQIKKSGESFTLPAKNTFRPPNEDQEFSGWKIGDDTNLKQPNETTTITGNTVIKAIWKPIEFKVTFQRETGASGNMDPVTVTKGSEYQLPQPTFKPDSGKEFAGWLVNGVTKKAGDKIRVTDNTTVTAKYKTISKPGSKDKKPDTGRIAGNNRYETSAKISQKYFKSADTVVLASGKNNADALVSASFANLKKAPILLTDTYSTDDSVIREIERLKAKNVIIVGGESSVGHSVETNMKSKGYNVRRLSGATRYETSAMIAQEVKDATGSNKAILINGSKEADALTVSSLATKKDLPVIMAKSNGIDRSVKDKLDSWNLQEIYVVGGTGSLPNSVVDKAKASNKKRIAGRDRYQTAMKIAEESYPNADRYMIANAYNPIDALSAGAVTAKANMPILLVNKANIPQGVRTKLDKKAKGVILLGGENTLTTNILNNISLVD
ncbi:cell wall-associated serine proteinase [Peptostreptococcus anaerobius CAG:621]|uniref:cell wall-binding repeat-containing protein n=1 Tax=Peptostreptococcus anaerobius TaxID=1261 RepID=UPI00033CA977|nr:cell wall-binding repeat-containing protein [Peptostreptococcus anaerobius]CCY47443.1 cell wall-associated serine proteinase [Peptostreptococcus anaerobius CAG:621]